MAPFFLLLTKQVYFQRFVAAFLPNAEFFLPRLWLIARVLWQRSGQMVEFYGNFPGINQNLVEKGKMYSNLAEYFKISQWYWEEIGSVSFSAPPRPFLSLSFSLQVQHGGLWGCGDEREPRHLHHALGGGWGLGRPRAFTGRRAFLLEGEIFCG